MRCHQSALLENLSTSSLSIPQRELSSILGCQSSTLPSFLVVLQTKTRNSQHHHRLLLEDMTFIAFAGCERIPCWQEPIDIRIHNCSYFFKDIFFLKMGTQLQSFLYLGLKRMICRRQTCGNLLKIWDCIDQQYC